jgi:hypothetical protein
MSRFTVQMPHKQATLPGICTSREQAPCRKLLKTGAIF